QIRRQQGISRDPLSAGYGARQSPMGPGPSPPTFGVIPMRLLYLNALGSMGGAERVLVDVLDGVRRERPSGPTALVLGDDGPLTEVARSLVNEVVVLPFPPQLAEFGDASVGDRRSTDAVGLVGRALAGGAAASRYVRRLRNAVTAFEPDVVHSNSLK